MIKQYLIFIIIINAFVGIGYSQDKNISLSYSDSIVSTCSEIAKLNELKLNVFYFAYTDSLDLILYYKLVKFCNDSNLFELTKHKSPIVKVYSYFGLLEKNASLLTNAIRMNERDTATVIYRRGAYSREIFSDRSNVIQIAKEIAYNGYTCELDSAILNDKDWNFIKKEQKILLKNLENNFNKKNIAVTGKALNRKYGASINLEDGNFYYVTDKQQWEKEIYGKEIEVVGYIRLKTYFQKTERNNQGELILRSNPPELIKTIELHKLVIIDN